MSALPHFGGGLLRQLGALLLELGALALVGLVGMQAGSYFASAILGLIAAGIAFLIGVAAWTSGRGASPRRR